MPTTDAVACPGCFISMVVSRAERLPLRLVKISFKCDTCGAAAFRIAREDDALDHGLRPAT
jgi:hypothetical protein